MSPDVSHTNTSWSAAFDLVQSGLNKVFSSGTAAEPDIAAFKGILKQLGAEGWRSDRKLYTFGRLDLDVALKAAEADLIPWWTVLTGRVYAGDLEGLRKVYDTAQKVVIDKESRPDLNPALTWISYPHEIQGYKNKIEPAVLQQMFDWGADANYDNGSWLTKAMYQCDENVINVWLDNGAALKHVVTAINKLNGRNAELHAKLLGLLPGRGFYDSLDSDTLLETKFVPDVGGVSTFKTIFNFKAQRVTETYESPRQTQPVMQTCLFEDYSTTALQSARTRLEKITGKPVEQSSRIEKKPFPRGLVVKTPKGGA